MQVIAIKQQALALLRAGRYEDAEPLLRRVCEIDKRDAEAWFLQGTVNGQLGRYSEAARCSKRALDLHAGHLPARANLATALAALGRNEEAIREYRTLLKRTPEDASLHCNLATTLCRAGRPEEAESHLRKAIALDASHAVAYYNLANLLAGRELFAEAIANYRAALRTAPDLFEALTGLGGALCRVGQFEEAVTCYRKAVSLRPADVSARHALGYALDEIGLPDAAIDCYRQGIERNPEAPELWCALGEAQTQQGDLAGAEESYRKALAIAPDFPDAEAGLMEVYERNGDKEAAYRHARAALDAGRPTPGAVVTFAAVCRKFGTCEEATNLLERMAQDREIPARPRRAVHFAAGKLYDSLGRYEEAFAHFRRGNELSPYRFDRASHARRIGELIEVFSAGRLDAGPRSAIFSDLPVFIVGMPRSGTSLVEQILASHSDVHGAGELNLFNKLTRMLPSMLQTTAPYPACVEQLRETHLDTLAQDYVTFLRHEDAHAARITDKMPHNFMHLGLISMIFPNARIIHCVRDARDTCLSIYFQQFSGGHPYATDLSNIGWHYRKYRELMAHWEGTLKIRMLSVHYEELVADPEPVARRMIEFCGLQWDDRCLRFHESDRTVATASYDQVREPVHGRAVGRWKHYEQYLEPLIQELTGLV